MGVRASDSLVDRECVPQVGAGVAGVAFLEVAVADSFQCTRFLQGCADIAGDGECLAMILAGLAERGSPVSDCRLPRPWGAATWPCRSPILRNCSSASWWLAAADW